MDGSIVRILALRQKHNIALYEYSLKLRPIPTTTTVLLLKIYLLLFYLCSTLYYFFITFAGQEPCRCHCQANA